MDPIHLQLSRNTGRSCCSQRFFQQFLFSKTVIFCNYPNHYSFFFHFSHESVHLYAIIYHFSRLFIFTAPANCFLLNILLNFIFQIHIYRDLNFTFYDEVEIIGRISLFVDILMKRKIAFFKILLELLNLCLL